MKNVNIIRGGRWLPAVCAVWGGLFAMAVTAAASNQATLTAQPVVEPLKIVNMVEPGYPPSMTLQGITSGDVELVFGVDASGQLDDYLITSYSKPEFAREVAVALKQWRFEPMRVDGAPVWSRAQLSFSFEARGVVITRTVMDSVSMLVGNMLDSLDRVHVLSRQSELDRPLVVVSTVAPLYPAQLAESGQSGVVTAEFYVDETGRVRLPVIESDAHPWFCDAAVRALLQWKFAPPMKNGRPTVVRVQQQFVFSQGK